jgi:hypothetical protein
MAAGGIGGFALALARKARRGSSIGFRTSTAYGPRPRGLSKLSKPPALTIAQTIARWLISAMWPRGQQLGVGLSDARRCLTQVLGVERGEQVGGGPLAAGPPIERRYFLLRPKSDLAVSAALSIASFTDDLAWSALPSLLRPLSSVTAPAASLARPLAWSTFLSVICVLL